MTVELHRLRYGPSSWQHVDIYDLRDRPAARPVCLIHGGFWRHDRIARDLEPAAAALARLGRPVAVIEYRPLWDGGAWPAAAEDCRAALRALGPSWAGAVLAGHSAGAHLACSAAYGRDLLMLAPVVDLALAMTLGVGGVAVASFLSGADPAAATPAPGPAVTVVTAGCDQAVPAALTAAQLTSWRNGRVVTHVEVEKARHMHLVNPERPAFRAVVNALERLG